jgi:hypothetical protein
MTNADLAALVRILREDKLPAHVQWMVVVGVLTGTVVLACATYIAMVLR